MGTVGTTQRRCVEVSDRSKRFVKSPPQSIFVTVCHKTTVNPRQTAFAVENGPSGGGQAPAAGAVNPVHFARPRRRATLGRAEILETVQWFNKACGEPEALIRVLPTGLIVNSQEKRGLRHAVPRRRPARPCSPGAVAAEFAGGLHPGRGVVCGGPVRLEFEFFENADRMTSDQRRISV